MSRKELIPINRPLIDDEEIRAVVRVLRSGVLTSKSGSGVNVMQFEDAFARFVGAKYAIAVNSGTAALHASLLAAGVGKNHEVIVPSFTFVATAEAVLLAGGTPVFVDIDPETYCLDPDEVEAAITARTKAIIPVHLYGLPADMGRIMKIAEDHDITVIEDAAQAHGAEYRGRRVGSLGHMACFSFYGSKNMVTGEGGIVTTSSRELAETLRSIRNHGEGKAYQSEILGHNYRMPEMEAALGYVQLGKLPSFLDSRSRNAAFLSKAFKDRQELQLPLEPEGFKHSWYVYTLRLKGSNAAKRNSVVRRIRERRVDCQVYYQKPIHVQPYYRAFCSAQLRNTEMAARQVFSLPVHPSLDEEDLERVVNAVKAALE
ncbi:MAG: DegT/DnrJ/EryC1/StrS family aminotransferase [Candidatus Bathyarchaeia archaeon]